MADLLHAVRRRVRRSHAEDMRELHQEASGDRVHDADLLEDVLQDGAAAGEPGRRASEQAPAARRGLPRAASDGVRAPPHEEAAPPARYAACPPASRSPYMRMYRSV